MKTVEADEASRDFRSILRDVRSGETVVVTSDGEAVATIRPAEAPVDRETAKQELLARLRSQPALNIPITWTRDELYDDCLFKADRHPLLAAALRP